MERNSLERQANLAAQKNVETQILQLNADLKKLQEDYIRINERKFAEHYGCSVEETYHKYATRLASCCGQGGEGYYWWLPGRGDKYKNYKPSYCHCVIMDYKRAQPTQQELDAFWIIHGHEMKIDQKPHYEHWGN